MTDKKKTEIVFAPGCFDNFEGTQEELDALINEIQEMFDSGEALENASLLTDMDDDELADLMDQMPEDDQPRYLQ